MKSNTLSCHLFAVACAIIWGSTFLVSKMLLETYIPTQIMIMRFFLAYLALWIICPKWKLNLRDEVGFFCMSLFGNTLYYLAENTALLYTYSSNVSILVSAAPVATAILVLIVHRISSQGRNDQSNSEPGKNNQANSNQRRISKEQMTGICVAFLGMALVVFNGSLVLKLSPKGDILSLGGALCWGFYSIILERYTDRYSSMMISRKLMLYGMIQSLPIMFYQMYQGGHSFPIRQIFQPNYLMGILFLGFIGSAFCYIAWNTACAGIGVVSANMYIYTIPFVTLIAGNLIYKEPITLMAVAGALLIALGMMVSSGMLGRKQESKERTL